MANPRVVLALLMQMQQEEQDDDDDAVIAVLYAMFMRRRQRRLARRNPVLEWFLRRREILRLLGPVGRLSVQNFVDIVWRYPDVQFYEDFRMPRDRFQELLQLMGDHLSVAFFHQQEPVENKLLLTLWTLANRETFRQTANRFGFPSRSSAHHVFKTVCRIFHENADLFIQWPSPDSYEEISEAFSFPQTIGAMDGTYIYIRRPLVGGNSYFNRKQRHSVTLQGVCTRDRRLIHVSTGWPSAMHDTRIFNESDLSTSLPLLLQGTDFHLIADGGYQLSVHVMTPYTRNRRLNLQEERYNAILSGNRQVIERAWTLLKGKWRRLFWVDVVNLRYLNYLIIAACCLHNFTLDLPFTPMEEDEIDLDAEEEEDNLDEDRDEAAQNKRDAIAAYFIGAIDEDSD